MGRKEIRRLPVVENGRMVGIATERGIFRLILAHQNLILESVAESLPTATREQLRGLTGHLGGLGTPPGKANEPES